MKISLPVSFLRVSAVAVLLTVPAAARAQGTAIQIIGGSELSEALTDGGEVSMSFGGPSFSMGTPIGMVNPKSRSELFNLLTNESVRKELKLSEEQYEGAQKIMKASQKRMSDLLKAQMSKKDGGGILSFGGADFRELMEENREQAESAIEEILLPAQLERVQQLGYQIDIHQEGGTGESLVNGRLGEEIGVREEQKRLLAEKAAKIEAEAKAAIIAIRAQARAKLFKELVPEQRKAAEELLGDFFLFEEPSLGQRIRKSMKQVNEQREEKDAESKPRKRR